MPSECSENGLWTKFSESRLVELEKKILDVLKTAYRGWFVSIGSTVGTDDKIWTIALNEESKKTPVVLLHGFAAGIGFWCQNLDAIAIERPVYAIDLLGFGRSSRPQFSCDSEVAEQQMVNSLEEWRKKMQLERIILLGHSFGGYLATSYAINYPERVKHLILVDPWGFTERPPNFNPPLWVKTLSYVLYPLKYLNPLAAVRAAGPAGPWLVRKLRTDISSKFEDVLQEKDLITEYIYQCNAQKPTGESAFHGMLKGFGWAKHPMVHRVDKLNKDVAMTIMFGAESWIDKSSGPKIKELRSDCYVNIKVIEDAGHHVPVDQPESFNELVVDTCQLSDEASKLSQTDTPKINELESKKNLDVMRSETSLVNDDFMLVENIKDMKVSQ